LSKCFLHTNKTFGVDFYAKTNCFSWQEDNIKNIKR
jgi:hypothetical protein